MNASQTDTVLACFTVPHKPTFELTLVKRERIRYGASCVEYVVMVKDNKALVEHPQDQHAVAQDLYTWYIDAELQAAFKL